MKNFTKTITNKTLFKTTRWLIMALILLVGTSSAWAQDMYVAGTMTNWATGQVKLSTASSTYSGYYYATFTVEAGTHEYKIKESGDNWWCSTYNTTNSSGVTYTSRSNNCNNIQIKTTSAGTLEIYHNKSNDNTFAKFYIPCDTPSAPSITINDGSSATLCSGSATIKVEGYNSANTYTLYNGNETVQNPTFSNGTFTVSEADTYYVTVTTCAESPKQTTGVTLSYYSAPTLTNKYSITNATKCNNTPNSDGSITITPEDGVTYTLTNGNQTFNLSNNTWSDLAAGEYILKATLSACSDLIDTETITVGLTDNTPTIGNITISGAGSFCNGSTTTLSCSEEGDEYQWYKGETLITGETNKILTINVTETASYKVEVIKTSPCRVTKMSDPVQVTKLNIPERPSLTSPAPVCEGTTVNLPTGFNWYNAETGGTEVQNTAITATGTYWAAAVENGCESATRARYDVTVNPLPNISISDNNSAVLYEDVELTVATDGTSISWEITEGDGSLSSTTGNSVTLTSSSAGNVTVTATATLGSCTATDTHEVEFSEEDCNSKITETEDEKTIEIWCRMSDNSTGSSIKCYGFEAGDFFGSYPGSTANNGTGTYESKTYQKWKYTFDSKKSGLKVIFNTQGDTDKTGDISVGNSGKRYYYWYNKSSKTYGLDDSETIYTTTTTPAPIKAPAVKMISAEYDEENDVIVAKGAVYKTGCGTTFWGFQYSTDGQKWGTEETDYIRPNPGNSLTKAGEFEYSFAIPNAGGGDIYYIRAYALNNYNKDNYNLSSAVYSTTSLQVEIPSKTIESATISLVDSEGKPSDATVVCPQSTVYLKVSYEGGDFKDYEAADNFPGTNLELVNHDKAHNYAIFLYTATATGVANITISNDNTSITTTNGVSITLKDVAPVNAPMISISQATICEDGSATITVNNPIENLTYTLYKETEPIGSPIKYQTGDLTFNNVTEAGSYTVRAEESICNNYANSMPVELKVVTSDVKIGLAVDNTTVNPWQPLKLTVTPPEGYAYTIDGLADVVYTQSGDVYTIKIPRPADWSIGNSGNPVKTKTITFSAKIQVTDDLTCGTSSVNVTLADTEENCE